MRKYLFMLIPAILLLAVAQSAPAAEQSSLWNIYFNTLKDAKYIDLTQSDPCL